MTDLNEWIKERRRIHDAATEGPWEAHGTTAATAWSGASDYSGPIDDREPVANASPEDVSAIVDAHNSLPSLLTAVENVLKRHQPKYLIRDGEWFPANCTVCEPWTWPCLTVQAIEGAINE